MSNKGQRNGTCARTACSNSHAIHYNRVTQRYYCTPCARRINESAQHDGIPLCDWPTREQCGPDRLLLPENVEVFPDSLPPIPPLDEIEACDNLGCAGNRDGQCIMTGSAICYGYMKPISP